MAKEVYHVVPHGDGWAVKREGNDRSESTHHTQKEAIESSRNQAATGDDIVIHRADGTVRDRVTYSGGPIQSDDAENGNGRRDVATSRPQAHDIWSVGTRVRWSAILSGVVVALALSALLTTFALAMGLSTMEKASGRTMVIVTGAVWALIMVLSMFAGGYVASRVSTRETTFEAMVFGVLVWGTTAIVLAMGAGASMNMALNATRTVASADTQYYRNLGWNDDRVRQYENLTNPDRVRQELNLTDEENRKYEEARQKSNEVAATVRNVNPQQATWWLLLGLLLGVGSAIGGAVVGAGPEVRVSNLRRANTPVGRGATQQADERVLV